MNWNKVVFLAHASEDKNRIRELYHTLKNNGLEPWLDEENLMPGAKWDDKIKEAIKKSKFFLACFSENSVSKNGYIQKELKLALSELEQKPQDSNYFIPALIDDVDLPNITVGTINLRDYQSAKIFNSAGLEKLIKYLKTEVNIIEEIKKEENPSFNSLRKAISEGKTENALTLLMEYVISKNDDLYNNVLLISSRYSKITNDNLLNLITPEFHIMETNKIVYSILETIKILEKKQNSH